MSKAFIPRAEQLSDPVVLHWLLQEIVRAREVHDAGRAGRLHAMLDDHLIESALTGPDEETALLAFDALDGPALSRFDDLILSAWAGWEGIRSFAGARYLGRAVPGRFLALLADLVRDIGQEHDRARLSTLLGALAEIGPAAAPVGREAISLWRSHFGAGKDPSFFMSAVAAAASLGLDEVPALLAAGQSLERPAGEHDGEPHPGETCLLAAEHSLGGGATFSSALLAVVRRESDLRLVDLDSLFEAEAPLEVIDTLARLPRVRSRERRTGARGLACRPHPMVACALATLDATGAGCNLSAEANARLDSFLLAAVAHSWVRAEVDVAGWSTADLATTLGSDVAILPHQDALVEALLADARAPDLARAIDAALWDAEGDGYTRLMWIAGESGDPALADAVLDCMTEDCDHELCEAAERALPRLGSSVEQAVIDAWPGLDSSQRAYASGVFERLGTERTILHLLRTFPQVRHDLYDLEEWTAVAEAVPDTRLLDLLEREAHRHQPAIDDALVTLGALLDVTTPAVMEARARKHASVQPGEYRLRSLQVQCAGCGDQNWCRVSRFWFNERTKEIRIDPEVSCPSCGDRGRLAASGFAHHAAAGELERIRQAEADGIAYPSPLVIARDDEARGSGAGKVGRNDPCPCGSGKKFKKCCIGTGERSKC